MIQQMVSTISELDGQTAVENALEWLRRECNSERAMFYQFCGFHDYPDTHSTNIRTLIPC